MSNFKKLPFRLEISPMYLLRLAEIFLGAALVFALIDLVRIPGPSREGPDMTSYLPAASAVTEASVHQAAHPSAALRSLFGSAPRDQESPGPALEPVRATDLNLVLKGIMADRNSDRKLALIAQADNEEQVYWLGESIAGAVIAGIESGRVILDRDGAYEALNLDVELARHASDSRSATDTIPGSYSQPADNRRVIDKKLLDRQMNDLAVLLRQANAVPHTDKDGRQIGYKFVSLPNGSVFRKLGLRQEDIIQTVNGTSVLNTREALEAYRDLKTANAFSISLLRDGRPITLDYSIQ
jgi:type II secretion system protein C